MALLHSLEDWLPASIAHERAMNAATPLLFLESLKLLIAPRMVLDPEDVIASALSNSFAMGGVLAAPERVVDAARAWLRASRHALGSAASGASFSVSDASHAHQSEVGLTNA